VVYEQEEVKVVKGEVTGKVFLFGILRWERKKGKKREIRL